MISVYTPSQSKPKSITKIIAATSQNGNNINIGNANNISNLDYSTIEATATELKFEAADEYLSTPSA